MRFIIANEFYEQMLQYPHHTPDCFVRPGEYLHHLYLDGVKYVVAQALQECIKEAQVRSDNEAIQHLSLHLEQFNIAMKEAESKNALDGAQYIGDPLPEDEEAPQSSKNAFIPREPKTVAETGLSVPFLFDMVLRTIYNRGQLPGADLATDGVTCL